MQCSEVSTDFAPCVYACACCDCGLCWGKLHCHQQFGATPEVLGVHQILAVRDGALGGRLERSTAALMVVTALAEFDSEG